MSCWLAMALVVPSTAIAAPPTPKPNVPKTTLPKPSPGKAAVEVPHRLAGTRPQVDSDSILAHMLDRQKPKKKGSVAAFKSAKVELAGGKLVTLSKLDAEAGKPHAAFSSKLKKLGKAVYGTVRSSTEVYEFANSYVLVKSTGVTVADPKKVHAQAPEFARLADGRKHSIIQSKLTAESKAGLAKFKKELASYPAGHPLRKAAAKGDVALLSALASGVGYVEVVDTIHLPKKAPKLTSTGLYAPSVKGGQVDYSGKRVVKAKVKPKAKNNKPTKPKLSSPNPSEFDIVGGAPTSSVSAAVTSAAAGSAAGGGFHETREFIAGETWGESWVWQRRWNVPSGFLRVTLGAHYALGLRVPIEVKTKMSPAWICDDGLKETKSRAFTLDVKAEAKDGDAAFYRRAGMAEAKVANGDELAITAGVGYGVKLRLFWSTLVDEPYRETGIDWGRDFDPPQGSGTTRVAEVFIPASLTKTKFAFGPLTGYAKLGFRVDVGGEVRARVTAEQEDEALRAVGRPSGSTALGGTKQSMPQRLVMANTGWKRYGIALRNHSKGNSPDYTDEFGFTVDEVEYDSDWSVVPGVKVHAKASYAGYGISGTWTYWVEAARLPIGSLRLDRHSGTRRRHDNSGGRKLWRRDRPGDTNWCVDNNPTV